MAQKDKQKDDGKDSAQQGWLTGQLLLSMPQMGDPRFHKAVIYICTHDEKGAMGLVVNHVLPGLEFNTLLEQFSVESNITVSAEIQNRPVLCGGPVETARGFILHSKDFITNDTIHVDRTFSVSGTLAALKAVAEGHGPKNMIFTLGYAGWGAGQLEQEMRDNAWLTAQASDALIFDTPAVDMWDKAIGSIGIDPAMLSGDAGRA